MLDSEVIERLSSGHLPEAPLCVPDPYSGTFLSLPFSALWFLEAFLAVSHQFTGGQWHCPLCQTIWCKCSRFPCCSRNIYLLSVALRFALRLKFQEVFMFPCCLSSPGIFLTQPAMEMLLGAKSDRARSWMWESGILRANAGRWEALERHSEPDGAMWVIPLCSPLHKGQYTCHPIYSPNKGPQVYHPHLPQHHGVSWATTFVPEDPGNTDLGPGLRVTPGNAEETNPLLLECGCQDYDSKKH